jgi:hypothetical protein
VLKVGLVWHRETDDVDVGDAYLEVLPPVGTLIAFMGSVLTDGVWRVIQLYAVPAHGGSATVLGVQKGYPAQVGQYYAFVIPAEGPYHP